MEKTGLEDGVKTLFSQESDHCGCGGAKAGPALCPHSAAPAVLRALAARAVTAELSPGLTAWLCHGEWM